MIRRKKLDTKTIILLVAVLAATAYFFRAKIQLFLLPEYDNNKMYPAGAKVKYKGLKYGSKEVTQGNPPDWSTTQWALIK